MVAVVGIGAAGDVASVVIFAISGVGDFGLVMFRWKAVERYYLKDNYEEPLMGKDGGRETERIGAMKPRMTAEGAHSLVCTWAAGACLRDYACLNRTEDSRPSTTKFKLLPHHLYKEGYRENTQQSCGCMFPFSKSDAAQLPGLEFQHRSKTDGAGTNHSHCPCSCSFIGLVIIHVRLLLFLWYGVGIFLKPDKSGRG